MVRERGGEKEEHVSFGGGLLFFLRPYLLGVRHKPDVDVVVLQEGDEETKKRSVREMEKRLRRSKIPRRAGHPCRLPDSSRTKPTCAKRLILVSIWDTYSVSLMLEWRCKKGREKKG